MQKSVRAFFFVHRAPCTVYHFCNMKLLILLLHLFGFGKTKPAPPAQDGADIREEEKDIIEVQEVRMINTVDSMFHWILDPGHGPMTKGKQSAPLEDGLPLYEYEFNHDIVARVSKILEEKNIAHSQTVYLHPNLGNDLNLRSESANRKKTNKPKRLVSIHGNGIGLQPGEAWRNDIEGTETWIHPNASIESEEMARVFQHNLVRRMMSTDRGVKRANFHMLRKTKMPSVLLEVDFLLTNQPLAIQAMTDEYRDAVAESIVESILEVEFNYVS